MCLLANQYYVIVFCRVFFYYYFYIVGNVHIGSLFININSKGLARIMYVQI